MKEKFLIKKLFKMNDLENQKLKMNENISKINLDENQTTSQHEQQQRSRKKFTAKYLENEYFPNKIKNDNVLKSTGHYLKKYYMPNSNCIFSL